MKYWLWLKGLFHRKDKLTLEEEIDVAIAEKEIATGKAKSFDNADDLLADLHKTRPVHTVAPKPGRQATRQDIGKFMKHGRQAPYYRKSIKAKVKPEEED